MKALSLVLSLASFSASAQSIQWMRDGGAPIGMSNSEQADAVAVDDQGYAYVTGWVQGYSEFPPISVSVVRDCYIAKYDPMGTVQWVRTFGGPGNSLEVMVRRIKVDPDEGVYVCGYLTSMPLDSIAIFDTDTVFMGGYEGHAFLAKYDLNGNFQWVRHGGSEPYGAAAHDLDIDEQGNITVVGKIAYTSAFSGQTLVNTTWFDHGLLLKYAPDGTLLNLMSIPSTTSIAILDAVEVMPGTGDVYIGGKFGTTIDLNGVSLTQGGNGPVFVAKLDSAWQGQWAVQGYNNSPGYGCELRGIELDAFGNCYFTGGAAGTSVQFGTQSFTGPDAYTSEVMTGRLNANGTVAWLKHGGSVRADSGLDIITDGVGNSVVSGYLGGNILTADFDGTTVDILTQDAHCFIARYDANGLLTYAKRMGSGNGESGKGLAIVGDSAFYMCGITSGTTVFDTITHVACCWEGNLYIARFADAFQNASVGVSDDVTITEDALAYPNPVTDHIILKTPPPNVPVEIFDVLGQRICITRDNHVDVSAWNEGIYFVKVVNRTQRIVIQH